MSKQTDSVLAPSPTPFFINTVLCLYILFFYMDSLDAYNISSIPIVWLSKIGFIFLTCSVLLLSRFIFLRVVIFVSVVFGWLCIVSLLNIDAVNILLSSPIRLSVPYPFYVGLRICNILAFISVCYLTWWLLVQTGAKRLVKLIVLMGVIVGVVAIYYYFAQIFNLPLLSRNHIGTGGVAQKVLFSSTSDVLYIRAMGTFREPSFLSSWLLVPLCLSYVHRKSFLNFPALIMGIAILLTWSVSFILSFICSVFFAFLLSLVIIPKTKWNRRYKKLILKSVLLILIVSTVVYFVSNITSYYMQHTIKTHQQKMKNSNIFKALQSAVKEKPYGYCSAPHGLLKKIPVSVQKSKNRNSAEIVYNRILQLSHTSFLDSDRGYAYKYAIDQPFSLFGYGLGNANLYLSQYLYAMPSFYKYILPQGNSKFFSVSFLSLYLNVAFSLGWVGLSLLIVILISPIVLLFLNRKQFIDYYDEIFFLWVAYFSWLMLFGFIFEELTQQFALIFVLLVYKLRQNCHLPANVLNSKPSLQLAVSN